MAEAHDDDGPGEDSSDGAAVGVDEVGTSSGSGSDAVYGAGDDGAVE